MDPHRSDTTQAHNHCRIIFILRPMDCVIISAIKNEISNVFISQQEHLIKIKIKFLLAKHVVHVHIDRFG